MPRPEKVAAVAEIKERMEGAKAVFLAEYAGLSVKQQQNLRRGLREQGAEFKVVKMTLARRAAADLELGELDELLIGPTGLAFADTDAVAAAKVLKEFASSHDVFALKGGLLGTDFLTPQRIGELAEIAPRHELLAMLAGAMKAPLTSMAGLLAALPRGAATVFQQLLEKKESGEFAEGEPAPAEPAAATTDGQSEATEATDGQSEDTEVAGGEAAVSATDAEPEADTAADVVDEATAPEAEDEAEADTVPDDAEQAMAADDVASGDEASSDGDESATSSNEASADDVKGEASVEAASETTDDQPEEDEPAASGEEEE